MNRFILKKEISSLGINIIANRYVKKSQIRDALARLKVTAENKFDQLEYDEFFEAYVEAALWAETAFGDPKEEEEGDSFDSSFESLGYTVDDISEETLKQIKDDCVKFLNENYDLIKNDEKNGGNFEQAGHDFLLTRNRHGAGFWDGDWNEGDALTGRCRKFKEMTLYVGDDGKIYC
jgi:hypothetical protein